MYYVVQTSVSCSREVAPALLSVRLVVLAMLPVVAVMLVVEAEGA